ncbi:MAG: RNase adapter RapZ, partial [Pseudomonadota bacterium]
SVLESLADDPSLNVSLVYVDCDTDTLLRRFSETRRRHPLASSTTVLTGIEEERALLAPLTGLADVLIDTSHMSPHDLRAEVTRWFGDSGHDHLSVSVQSFSYKRGKPRSADMVMDCRFLKNPHWRPDLRALTGQDPAVAAHVAEDPLYSSFFDKTLDIIQTLLPAYKAEGKSYFTLALGCTGGRHRSVCVAESLAIALADSGWPVSIRHRELERAVQHDTRKDAVNT